MREHDEPDAEDAEKFYVKFLFRRIRKDRSSLSAGNAPHDYKMIGLIIARIK